MSFSSQAKEARSALWQLFNFLICLFVCGSIKENILVADMSEICKINRVKFN